MDQMKDNKKTRDSSLVRRLVAYAKPYWKMIIVIAILMLLSTFFELLRPYVLKIAIDDHINGIMKPMVVTQTHTPDSVTWNDMYFTRDTETTGIGTAHIKQEGEEMHLYYDTGAGEQMHVLTPQEISAFRMNDQRGLWILGLLFLAATIMQFFANYLQVLWLNKTGQNIIYTIRQQTFGHIVTRNLSFFDRIQSGRLVTRVTNDTENLNEMYTSVLLNLIKDILVIIGIVIVMLSLNTKLALISLSLTPLIFILAIFFRKKIRDNYRRSKAQLSALNGYLAENIAGIVTTKIFSKEQKQFDRFDEQNENYYQIAREEVILFSIFRPSIEMIRSLGIALLIWVGAQNVAGGILEFGVLYAFIDYMQRFFEPILDLTEQYNVLQSAMASSERIFEVLDNEDAIENKPKVALGTELKGRIEFENVWFSYVEDNWVLKDVSFVIEPGETVAFVGATGAGKTSIINLINRSYDIQKGRILLDGVDIRDYDLHELRKQIGIVLQDIFLFTGTIKDNINVGKQDATDEEIEEVARYVNAHPFIERLPDKYNEKVTERGSTLSTGERQLLAFARTLLADPTVLILDEATSSIDTHTEEMIQDALEKLSRDRTTIAIAHRLSTIQNSDKIFVLAHGEIVESGNHESLLEQNGLYSILHRLQLQEVE